MVDVVFYGGSENQLESSHAVTKIFIKINLLSLLNFYCKGWNPKIAQNLSEICILTDNIKKIKKINKKLQNLLNF